MNHSMGKYGPTLTFPDLVHCIMNTSGLDVVEMRRANEFFFCPCFSDMDHCCSPGKEVIRLD